MRSTLSLALLASAVALPIVPAVAQEAAPSKFGFFGGVSIEPAGNTGLGLQFGGLVNVGLTSRLGVQFDATLQTFRNASGIVYTPCPPPSVGPPFCSATRRYAPLTVASTTANIRYSAGAFHWLGGIGVYDVAESPTDGSYTRAGWNLGGGFRLNRSLFLDIRYHQLIQPKTTNTLVPVTFSVRF